jgi:hypothetical protein
MTEELLSMLHEMDETGPSRKVSLMGDNLGRNPADLFMKLHRTCPLKWKTKGGICAGSGSFQWE